MNDKSSNKLALIGSAIILFLVTMLFIVSHLLSFGRPHIVGHVAQEMNDHHGYVFHPSTTNRSSLSMWLQKSEGKWYGLVKLNDTNHVSRLYKLGFKTLGTIDAGFHDYYYTPYPGLLPFYDCPNAFWDGASMRYSRYQPLIGFMVIVELTPDQIKEYKVHIDKFEKEIELVDLQLQKIEAERLRKIQNKQ